MKIAVSPKKAAKRPSSSAAGLIERGRRRLIDAAPFGGHVMIVSVLDPDRKERAGAHVQCDAVKRRAFGENSSDELIREMQAGGRGGDRARLVGEDRLVARAVE